MLKPGAKLGPYEVLAQLGAGGMGEVYKARDLRLDRFVAIKILPEHLASNPELRERFEREARSIAKLNHPHICTLYDIGQQGGTNFLVMEYLEGETLSARLKKGPLPLDQVLRYAVEISDALDKAHRAGVTHRDIKPANVMLVPGSHGTSSVPWASSGSAAHTKLLDFGLAKLKQEVFRTTTPASEMPTVAGELTEHGTLLGTLHYMAPEQVEGKVNEIDSRTDIFAFGALVYEMATGKKAFPGETQASVIAKILEVEPPSMSSLQPMTPPTLDRVVKKCLAKDPDDRWHSAKDLCDELKWIKESSSQATSEVSTAPPSKVSLRLAWGITTIAVVVAFALGALYFSRRSAPPETMRFSVVMSGAIITSEVVSPDGRYLAFNGPDQSGRLSLWIRRMDSLEARPLPGTENADLGSSPFWSPDSRFLGFFAEGKLKKVELSGGLVQTLADAPNGRGGAWNPDGVILFSPHVRSGLSKVSAAGGAVSPVTTSNPALGERNHRWPKFLPDGRHFLFFSGGEDPKSSGIYVGSLDSNETKRLLTTQSEAAYAPPGYLLFLQGDTLMAQPFDAARLELTGDPAAVAEAIDNNPLSGSASFSVSEGGILTYANSSERNTQLTWFDRNGMELGTLGPSSPSNFESTPELSPDGKTVAVSSGLVGADDIWLWDVAAKAGSRFTFDPARDNSPQWSPDGSRIVFKSTRNGGRNDLYQKESSGSGTEELFFENPGTPVLTPQDWSSDGRFILYMGSHERTRLDLWVLPLEGDRKPFPYLETPASESHAQFSPDGHWVAYASDESGQPEVYIQSFPKPGSKRQVSTGGGQQPRWRGDGRELYYLAPDRKLMAAPVRGGTTVEVGPPAALFQTRSILTPLVPGVRQQYDVAADGRRFLFLPPPEENINLVVVLNWTDALRR